MRNRSPDEIKAGLGRTVVYENRALVPRRATELLAKDYPNGKVIRLDRAIRVPPLTRPVRHRLRGWSPTALASPLNSGRAKSSMRRATYSPAPASQGQP
jgi:hypothetical protein